MNSIGKKLVNTGYTIGKKFASAGALGLKNLQVGARKASHTLRDINHTTPRQGRRCGTLSTLYQEEATRLVSPTTSVASAGKPNEVLTEPGVLCRSRMWFRQ
jgi:hypothetical protein